MKRSTKRTRVRWLSLVLGVLLSGCYLDLQSKYTLDSDAEDDGTAPQVNTDTDADIDTDTDTDTKNNASVDGGADSGEDTEPNTDTDTDADTDSEYATESYTDSETESETHSDTETTGTTSSDSETASEIPEDSETDTGTGAGPGPEPDTETERTTDSDTASSPVCPKGWIGDDCNICVVYVDKDKGSDIATGGDWSDAMQTISAAIEMALGRHEGQKCQIWVAAVSNGAYRPDIKGGGVEADGGDDVDPRSATIALEDGIEIYGGFTHGDKRFDDRDPQNHPTKISGIFVQDDVEQHVYHVVKGADQAVLDGFVISDGKADGNGDDQFGGGMLVSGKDVVTIRNCVFRNNTAIHGGAMANKGGARTVFKNTVFEGNTAESNGGALFNHEGDIELIQVLFSGNTAEYGGAVYNTSLTNSTHLSLMNALLYNNHAIESGGGICNDSATSTVVNATFYNNRAERGSAVYEMYTETAFPRSEIVNSIVWNRDAVQARIIETDESSSIAVTYSDVRLSEEALQYSGDGNISEDPLFVDGDDGDGSVDLRLSCSNPEDCSPCVDVGLDTAVTPGSEDLAGENRIVGLLNRDSRVDMGAYELQEMRSGR